MFLCCCFWQVHQCGALFRRHVHPLQYVYFHSHSLLCWNDIKLLTFFVPQACSLGQCWLPPLSSAIPTGPEPYSEQFPEPWGFWHPTMRVMTPSLLHTACTPRNMSSLKRCVFSVTQGICQVWRGVYSLYPRNMSSLKRCVFSVTQGICQVWRGVYSLYPRNMSSLKRYVFCVPKEYVKSEEVCILCTQGICQVWRGVYAPYPKEYVKSEEVCILCTPRNMSSLKRCVCSVPQGICQVWRGVYSLHYLYTKEYVTHAPPFTQLVLLSEDPYVAGPHVWRTCNETSLSYKTSLGPHISVLQDQLGTCLQRMFMTSVRNIQ